MSILQGLFGGSKAPSAKQIAGQVTALQRRHGEPSLRYAAADKLAAWGTTEAIEGLLRRFAVNVASETSDEDEKAYVGELVTDKLGHAAVEPIERYLRREEQVSWPLRLLSKIVSREDYRTRVLGILGSFDVHYDRSPERKVEMIHALMEHADHSEVPDLVARFLEDTSDTVRIAAIELVGTAGREQDVAALVASLAESAERPRVRSALLQALAERPAAIAGRRAEIEPMLTEGWYLTREGTLKRLAK